MTPEQKLAITDAALDELDAALTLARGAAARLRGVLTLPVDEETTEAPEEPQQPRKPSKGAMLLERRAWDTETFGGPDDDAP